MPQEFENKKINQPLGVYSEGSDVYLFYICRDEERSMIKIDRSSDGINFNFFHKNVRISDDHRRPINIDDTYSYKLSKIKDKYVLTFQKLVNAKPYLYVAYGKDLTHFKKVRRIVNIKELSMVVPQYLYRDKYVLYFGNEQIYTAFGKDLFNWQTSQASVIKGDKNFFGDSKIKLAGVIHTDEGLLVAYYQYHLANGTRHYALKTALFDKEDPNKLLFKTTEPIWEFNNEWLKTNAYPIGVVSYKDKLISYWIRDDGIQAVSHPYFRQEISKKRKHFALALKKFRKNPIIKPIADRFWESKATFNPAAIFAEGKVHIVYRAIGDHDVSVLGYAESADGLHIDKRHPEPIYIPKEEYELSGQFHATLDRFASGGGGYGGCEDPRLIKIDDKIYMTYVAYNGWQPPRVALTKIDAKDFFDKKWDWSKSMLISPPGVVDKNAVIFPEKINGKYVIMHRIFPNILVDFLDDLDFESTKYLQGKYKINPRSNMWDSRKIGAGPPPIKTKDGWLLIYHAVGNHDSARYKMGAMLLDLKDPLKVLARTNHPILEPIENYENEGFKFGVAYPCGAVDKDGQLLVYYGGADTVTCVAQADMEKFVHNLKLHNDAELMPVNLGN
jgi:predicted GH43/DUF377 family glycosyl hydrolase